MKRLLTAVLLAAFGLMAAAQDAWHQGTVQSGLDKAGKEGKILFLKFYSDT